MLRKVFSILGLLLFGTSLFCQMDKDLFPLDRQYRRSGFYINPELTYLLPIGTTKNTEAADTLTYQYEVNGSGKIKYGIELGYFYSFKKSKIVHFVEGGIGYRAFAGEAEHKGTLFLPSDTTNFSSSNTINYNLAQISLRATHVKQLKRYSFISNSLGLNANYAISEKFDRSSSYPNNFDTFTNSFNGFLTYQIGFGYRITKHTILIPSIETTLLQVFPIDEVGSNFQFFSHDYHPIIFKLRIMLLRKDPVNCNAPSFKGPQPAL